MTVKPASLEMPVLKKEDILVMVKGMMSGLFKPGALKVRMDFQGNSIFVLTLRATVV